MAKLMTEEQIAARRDRIAKRAGRPPTRVKVPQEVYVKQGKITGRPSLKTPAVMDEIIAGVAGGRSLANVCKDNEALPDVRNVYRWMDQDEGFRLRYLRACANRSLVYADTIGDIASATLDGRVDPNAARVAINAYQWIAARLVPDTYGERQEVTVNHQHLHLHALQQLSAAAKAGQAAILQREAVLQVDRVAVAPPVGGDGGGHIDIAPIPAYTEYSASIPPTETPHPEKPTAYSDHAYPPGEEKRAEPTSPESKPPTEPPSTPQTSIPFYNTKPPVTG
jgi:hypothetical protein